MGRILFVCFFMGAVVSWPWADDRGQSFDFMIFDDNSPYFYASDGLIRPSFGRGPDDQFTFGFRLGYERPWPSDFSDRLTLSFGQACFTDDQYYALASTGVPAHPAWRLDADTLVGRFTKQMGPLVWDYGAGLAARGNLGGEALQNGFHQIIGDRILHLAYADSFFMGPLVTAGVTFPWGESQAGPLSLKPYLQGGGTWDLLGVLHSEVKGTVGAGFSTYGVSADAALGYRFSFPGAATYLSSLYSSGMVLSYDLGFDGTGWGFQVGYTLNPFGSASISGYPAYHDENQEYSWMFYWGEKPSRPLVGKFYP